MRLDTGARLDRYEVLSPLGAGGMGEVYLALDTRLKRKVALKLLPAQLTQDADRVRRFIQEAKAASALNHPNIITIHEIGDSDGTYFIVTEFIDGETLRHRIAAERLPLPAAIEIAVQVTSALSAAHEAGITHRDIKPENVMLRRDGIVKVLDFGLAKLAERHTPSAIDTEGATLSKVTTDPGVLMGTPQYMSPEQARGKDVDARTDLFSLGVVLYEMIGGRPAFEGVNALDVISAMLQKEPAPLGQHRADLPEELQRLIDKSLRKDRDERYQTSGDLLNDLKQLKEELAFTAKLERARRLQRGEAATLPADAGATAAGTAPTTSSLKIIVGEIKRHKLATLVALLVLAGAATSVGRYWHAPTTDVAIDSIAVLPFANQNRAEDIDYLVDGLTESLINNLTQLSNLRVIARDSVFRYKGKEADLIGAGQGLGVRAVVVGRVRQRGEHLTISAELVDVRENKQLWGQQYNRKLADVFAVQEEIAKEISEKLRAKLSGAERQQLAKRPTENLKAFQYYTLGRAYSHRRFREDLLTAIRHFEKAIEEDRNYALAYAGLANTYASLGVYGYVAPSEGRRKAEDAARNALALDDNLAEAHTVLGQIYVLFAPYSFSLGDRELRHAVELSPGLALAHWYLGISLMFQGRLDEGQEELLKARELSTLTSHRALSGHSLLPQARLCASARAAAASQ